MLVMILFPVISVSDDLWSLQNPAETDTCQRRDLHADLLQHHFPVVSFLPEQIVAVQDSGYRRLDAPRLAEFRVAVNPALGPVENRPPPVC